MVGADVSEKVDYLHKRMLMTHHLMGVADYHRVF